MLGKARRHHHVLDGPEGGGGDALSDSDDCLPPTNFRLPPDGHEFPDVYVDRGSYLEQDALSRKSSASSTASLERGNPGRTITGVRAKIAMFSHGKPAPAALGKFQSSEDIGQNASFASQSSLTRAHTHGDVRFEDKSKKLNFQATTNTTSYKKKASAEEDYKVRKNNPPFRSMINVSSNKYYGSAKVEEEKAASINDLSKSTTTIFKEERKKPPPVISNRSQSLGEIVGKLGPTSSSSSSNSKSSSMGGNSDQLAKSRSRSSNMLGQNNAVEIKGSLNMLEQRRRCAMNKLKGLVIPEGKETAVATASEKPTPAPRAVNLSRANSYKKPAASTTDRDDPMNYRRYSAAFNRKSFTLGGGSSQAGGEAYPTKGRKFSPRKDNENYTTLLPEDLLSNKIQQAKQHLEEGSISLTRARQDSDNDSAVSSSRSSLSGRSSTSSPSPPKSHEEAKKLKIVRRSSSNLVDKLRNEAKSKESSFQPTPRPRKESKKTVSEKLKKDSFDKSDTSGSRHSTRPDISPRAFEDTADSDDMNKFIRQQSEHFQNISLNSVQSSNTFPDTILNLEKQVSYMSDIVEKASSITPTDRRSLSRTNSVASERSTLSNRSSRNNSIVSEKVSFGRTASMLSKDSALSEDLGSESWTSSSTRRNSAKFPDHTEKKFLRANSSDIGNKISKLISKNEDSHVRQDRPKDLLLSEKKSGMSSPNAKNFKELTEKWQTFSADPSPLEPLDTIDSFTLPRKKSDEVKFNRTRTSISSLTRSPKESQVEAPSPPSAFQEPFPWTASEACKNSFYQVSGETEWSGFDMMNKTDIPDRKFSVPVYNDVAVKLRDKKDNVPSRPSSLIESSDQKDMKIFEIGNLGDNNRLALGSNSTSRSSSQADLLDCTSTTSDPKSPLPSSSSREILDAFSNRNNRVAVSVNDIRRAFEKAEKSLSHTDAPKKTGLPTSSSHNRMSSLDSTTSDESSIPTPHFHGSVTSLTSGHSGLKDHYGSITSLASSTSVISPQELQNLIDEANQSLEESGTPSHEIMVIVLHREFSGGSIGITLAGGADYESKEITVHKVILGSLADKDGRIQKGDRVLSINGKSTKGVTHREALSILKAPRTEVVLVLSRSRSVTPAERNLDQLMDASSYAYINSSRPPKILESPLDSKSLLNDIKFVDVPRGSPITVNLKKEGTGLGFSLEGGKDSPFGDRPMTIKKIFTGGAADKNGTLKVGDEILSVNSVDVTRMTRLEAWNYMKKLSDGHQTVVVRQKLMTASIQSTSSQIKSSVPVEKSP